MKRNRNDRDSMINSNVRSNQKPHDDINILEPNPDSDLLLMIDEDEDLLDYSLMINSSDLDYDDYIT